MDSVAKKPWIVLLVWAGSIGTWCGCGTGPPLGKVAGKLTYKGLPVRYAAVQFQPISEGKGSIGWTDEQGNYVAQYTLRQAGVLIGTQKVSVRVYPGEGEKPIPVPAKYGGKSQVEFEVQRGSNRLDIELSAP